VDTAKIAALEKRLQSVEARLNESAVQNQGSPPQEAAQAPAESASDIAHMKNDMIAMSSALGAVQEEVKQNGSNAAQNRQAVQGMLAEAVAFIQLRESVVSGRSYTAELASMRAAAANDNRFAEALSKLDASAAKGVPSPSALEDELIAAEPAAEQSIDKSNAHGWWERLLAELKGLITIRPLHGGGATDAFGVMESALQKGDVAAALDALKNLPPAAQESLADWKASAEARLNADTARQRAACLARLCDRNLGGFSGARRSCRRLCFLSPVPFLASPPAWAGGVAHAPQAEKTAAGTGSA
jgi:hypothetical protein